MRIGIVGAGIIGLAHAYWAHKIGHEVILFEKNNRPLGASIRNFGLIWPIGQEKGTNLELALKSRETWIELSEKAGFWLSQNGSLHLAYHPDEWEVLNQFVEQSPTRGFNLVEPEQLISRSPLINSQNLVGGLISDFECTVNPREALTKLVEYLERQPELELNFNETVLQVADSTIQTNKRKKHIDQVIICNGSDYQTIFPDFYQELPLTKCKLQMLKGKVQPSQPLGPTLCGGLTLLHYAAFGNCIALPDLSERLYAEWPGCKEYGIHVMLAQNNQLELIIGDSHQYGADLSPFNQQCIDNIILDYLRQFARLPGLEITERWHGVYSKTTDGSAFIRKEPAKNVMAVTGLGGAGMTLSFGIAQQTIEQLCS